MLKYSELWSCSILLLIHLILSKTRHLVDERTCDVYKYTLSAPSTPYVFCRFRSPVLSPNVPFPSCSLVVLCSHPLPFASSLLHNTSFSPIICPIQFPWLFEILSKIVLYPFALAGTTSLFILLARFRLTTLLHTQI